jgi:hypothetical protein
MSPSYAGDLVMSRATANFEIIVTESEEEFWDTSDAWDDECKDLYIADLLTGRYELKNLEIIVREKRQERYTDNITPNWFQLTKIVRCDVGLTANG